jgi:predicted transcriptional regulator
MTLRLSAEEAAALRATALREGRSMQEVARDAITRYTADRQARLDAIADRVLAEDGRLLDRLAE